MSLEQQVAGHYARPGLEDAILDALRRGGRADVEHLTTVELAGADEFHFGWRPATIAFARNLGFQRGARILDIGSGLGGPARHFAEAYAVSITGIDLADDFVSTANGLTGRCGLSDLASFQVASALAMPFEDAAFDGAYTVHVAMNIADKAKLFAETRRVVKSGARFGIYDVMRIGDGDVPYPMPWAVSVQTSFVDTPAAYRNLLETAGFAIESEVDRGDLTLELARQMQARVATDGPPPLGLHTLMGPATPERLSNAIRTLEARIISPIEIIARAA